MLEGVRVIELGNFITGPLAAIDEALLILCLDGHT